MRSGLPAEAIRTEAREFAASPSAVCYGRVGISTQSFGGLASWLMNAVNAITGNLDRAGGFMFTKPAIDRGRARARAGLKGRFAKYRSRVRGAPDFGGEWPVATLAEEIETEGKGQIKALVTLSGNPVLSSPNGGRLEGALRGLDFMVSIDPYRERDEPPRASHPAAGVASDPRSLRPCLPPARGAEHREVFARDLRQTERRLVTTGRFSSAHRRPRAKTRRRGSLAARLTREAMGRLGPQGVVGGASSLRSTRRRPESLRSGCFARPDWSVTFRASISVRSCRVCPGGSTPPSKRIDLVPKAFVDDLPRLRDWMRRRARPVAASTLIGRREVRSNNSWMHNSARLMERRGPLHADDASKRCIGAFASRMASGCGSRPGPVRSWLPSRSPTPSARAWSRCPTASATVAKAFG